MEISQVMAGIGAVALMIILILVVAKWAETSDKEKFQIKDLGYILLMMMIAVAMIVLLFVAVPPEDSDHRDGGNGYTTPWGGGW